MTIKEELHKQCSEFIEKRLATIQNTLAEIQKALLSETKSSAGDKHETGRAMLQLEREKAGDQLAEVQKLSAVLAKTDPLRSSSIAVAGSVVYTSKNNYYLGISAGEIKLTDELFYAISPQTPIGQLLLSRSVGDTIHFREQKFTIIKII